MKSIIYYFSTISLLFSVTIDQNQAAYKEVLASSNACYPSTTYTATIFNAPENGQIVGIKAVHNSGGVTQSVTHYPTKRNWGGEGFQVEFLKVTNAASWSGITYYPQPSTEGFIQGDILGCSRGCTNNRYDLSPYTINDPEIVFMNPSYEVTTSDKFMFQMTEGCCLHTIQDNGGTGCATIYFLYNLTCEEKGEIKHINWNNLQNAVDNSAEIPYSSFNMNLDANALTITYDIDLEYIGLSSDGNFDSEYNLGTTYVIDFQSFGVNENLINEPGNCQNRISSSFVGITDFNDFWNYSEYPFLESNIGSNTYLSYPPVSNYWTLTIESDTCSPIKYFGVFSWNDLSQCTDFNGNQLIDVVDDGTSITLSGTLFVNLVSPYQMDVIDNGYYRSFPLIQQDFEISILKQINVLSSTGVELFISSIIGIYEDETDGSFELSILTQSADYIKLINPTVLATPFGISSGVSINSVTLTCLSASTYTCGQIFTLSISANNINCPPADMSGIYDIAFDVECRFNEEVCNTFINDNGGTTVALSVESNFIDHTCEPEIYSIIFDGNMTFYDDSAFLIKHTDISENYVIGQDIIYVEIAVDFPEDGSVNNYYNVFQVDIQNVFVCTADDNVDMTQDLDQQNGNGGCVSSNIDADGPYDIIINGISMNYDANIILSATESNIVRFSFKTFDIGRTKMYIHAQLMLTLTNGVRRRLNYRLLSVSNNLKNDETQQSNQIRHFVDSTTVISNDETVNMFSTKSNVENSDNAQDKWMQIVTVSLFILLSCLFSN